MWKTNKKWDLTFKKQSWYNKLNAKSGKGKIFKHLWWHSANHEKCKSTNVRELQVYKDKIVHSKILNWKKKQNNVHG